MVVSELRKRPLYKVGLIMAGIKEKLIMAIHLHLLVVAFGQVNVIAHVVKNQM